MTVPTVTSDDTYSGDRSNTVKPANDSSVSSDPQDNLQGDGTNFYNNEIVEAGEVNEPTVPDGMHIEK